MLKGRLDLRTLQFHQGCSRLVCNKTVLHTSVAIWFRGTCDWLLHNLRTADMGMPHAASRGCPGGRRGGGQRSSCFLLREAFAEWKESTISVRNGPIVDMPTLVLHQTDSTTV